MKEQKHYSRKNLVLLFDSLLGKFLGDKEVDVKNIFEKTKEHPKITGIAGMVVEQSILGYPANQDQKPDIFIENIETEVKTTGIRRCKKNKNNYEAKEPMSITAVSIPTIVNEEFESSHFWSKVAHMFIVYYLYDSDTTVKAADYAMFPLIGYEFHDTDDVDKEILKNDWELVRNFIIEIQKNYVNPEEEYPRLSHELRDKLLLIDTAPKYPHPPRFRFKRAYVSSLVDKFFNHPLEILPERITKFTDIDSRCHQYTMQYKGKTVGELMKIFGLGYINTNLKKKVQYVNKNICEEVVVRMFGGKAKKLNGVEDFNKIGIIGKTITMSPTGGRTEDLKLMPIDFNEITSPNVSFEGKDDKISSEAFDKLSQNSYLCIIFQEAYLDSPINQNIFLGFKRLSFNDDFLMKQCKPVWEEVRSLVINKELRESVVCNKDGSIRINDTGMIQTSLNFPKMGRKNSQERHDFFVRGSGLNSSKKTEVVNEIHMYQQYFWISGQYIIDSLKKEDFL